ncbi:MAG: ATP synthase subunit I [Desulfuromonadales bacterium]|nr:ATP synthase subunit I [Desulfuromonadales bacterium]
MRAAIHEDNLVAAIVKGSAALILVFSLSGLVFFSFRSALGILAGGAIGMVNFLWMRSILRRTLGLLPSHPGRYATFWFLVRMAAVACTLYFLMVSGSVSLIGLLVGLSIIAITTVTISLFGIQSTGG